MLFFFRWAPALIISRHGLMDSGRMPTSRMTSLTYKDLRNFKTYTLKCMVELVDDKTLPDDQGKFVVYSG